MANTKSAKKAMRVSLRKNVINKKIMGSFRHARLKIKKSLAASNFDEADKSMVEFQSAIDSAVKKGVIKKNTGSRYKSRMSKAITDQKLKK